MSQNIKLGDARFYAFLRFDYLIKPPAWNLEPSVIFQDAGKGGCNRRPVTRASFPVGGTDGVDGHGPPFEIFPIHSDVTYAPRVIRP